MTTMRIVLVEDHLAYRESLSLALQDRTTFQIAAEAGSCREALTAIESERPDLVVSDFLLPDSDGLSLAREMKRRRLRIPMMLLTRMAHPVFLDRALRLGVRGYALKHESLQELADGIRRVGAGE